MQHEEKKTNKCTQFICKQHPELTTSWLLFRISLSLRAVFVRNDRRWIPVALFWCQCEHWFHETNAGGGKEMLWGSLEGEMGVNVHVIIAPKWPQWWFDKPTVRGQTWTTVTNSRIWNIMTEGQILPQYANICEHRADRYISSIQGCLFLNVT